MPEIHNIFTRHRLELTARLLGRYSEEVVREFYASYVATLRSQIDRRAAPAKRPHWSRFESGACRLTFPCQLSIGSYTVRVQMLRGLPTLPSLTTAGR